MQHTPGPWRWTNGHPVSTERLQEVACLPHIHYDAIEVFAPVREQPGPHECELAEFEANARLIAAAPELFDVARFLTCIDFDLFTEHDEALLEDVIERAKNALAKIIKD